MKILLTAAAVTLTLALTAPATVADEVCDSVSVMAEAFMSLRQAGADMGKAMGLATQAIVSLKSDGVETTAPEEMVIGAYETPRYSTKAVQVRAIADFKNEWYLNCVKTTRVLKAK